MAGFDLYSSEVVIQSFNCRGLDALQNEGKESLQWQRVGLNEVLKLMEDLIEYFAQPPEDTGNAQILMLFTVDQLRRTVGSQRQTTGGL